MNSVETDYPPPTYKETMTETGYIKTYDLTKDQYVDTPIHGGNVYYDQTRVDSEGLEYDYDAVIQQDAYLRKQLEQNYPVKYVIFHSVLMILINLTLISLQIIAMNNDAALSYMGSAIWAGIYNLATVIMAIATIKYRNPSLVTFTTTMKLFGMIISFGGFILVHMVAFYHYNCIAASYYRPCYNKKMKPIHYAIIVLGVPCLILNIMFFVYFQFKVMGKCRRYHKN